MLMALVLDWVLLELGEAFLGVSSAWRKFGSLLTKCDIHVEFSV